LEPSWHQTSIRDEYDIQNAIHSRQNLTKRKEADGSWARRHFISNRSEWSAETIKLVSEDHNKIEHTLVIDFCWACYRYLEPLLMRQKIQDELKESLRHENSTSDWICIRNDTKAIANRPKANCCGSCFRARCLAEAQTPTKLASTVDDV